MTSMPYLVQKVRYTLQRTAKCSSELIELTEHVSIRLSHMLYVLIIPDFKLLEINPSRRGTPPTIKSKQFFTKLYVP